jgi:hypothetical protein
MQIKARLEQKNSNQFLWIVCAAYLMISHFDGLLLKASMQFWSYFIHEVLKADAGISVSIQAVHETL